MDGYRRLERTRSVAGTAAVVGAGTVKARVRRSTRLTGARVAGALRLVGFVGVLALIVGTSVSLASADERSAPAQRATAKPMQAVPAEESTSEAAPAPMTVAAVTAREAAAPKDDVSPTVEAAEEVPAEQVADAAAEPDAVAVDATATAGTASGATPQAALPLTGDVQVRWLLLGGAVLVLVGMLVQVAGQPLPARSHARS